MNRKLNGWRCTSRLSEEELAWLRQFEGCDYAAANAGRYADTLRVAGEYVRPGSAVVDLGSYPGHLALLLRRRHGVAVTGISFSHTATFVARMASEGITVVEGDLAVADPQLPPASFDIALCTEIIEHLDRPLPLLVRANRLLRAGGILVLSTPNHAALKCRLNLLAGRPTNAHLFGTRQVYQMNEWVHRREYTAGELARLLEPVGFAVETVRYSWLDHAPAGVRGMLAAAAKGLLRPISSLAGGIILAARKTAPAAYTSRVPDVLRAFVRPAAAVVRGRPGGRMTFQVEVENTGSSTWLAGDGLAYGFVQLGAHLLADTGELLELDFLRVRLPHDLGAGERVTLAVEAPLPARPGFYALELDLVNENVSWFRAYGSPTALVRVEVVPQ